MGREGGEAELLPMILASSMKKGEVTVENAFAYSLNPKGLERLM